MRIGSISNIRLVGSNDRNVSEGNSHKLVLSARFVAVADVRVLESHRTQRLGRPLRSTDQLTLMLATR